MFYIPMVFMLIATITSLCQTIISKFSAGGDVRGSGGYVVIHGSPGAFRTADLSVMKSQSGKSLRAGNFMKEMSVHVEDGKFAFLSADDM
jgi:hypothetical protein